MVNFTPRHARRVPHRSFLRDVRVRVDAEVVRDAPARVGFVLGHDILRLIVSTLEGPEMARLKSGYLERRAGVRVHGLRDAEAVVIVVALSPAAAERWLDVAAFVVVGFHETGGAIEVDLDHVAVGIDSEMDVTFTVFEIAGRYVICGVWVCRYCGCEGEDEGH